MASQLSSNLLATATTATTAIATTTSAAFQCPANISTLALADYNYDWLASGCDCPKVQANADVSGIGVSGDP